MKLQSILFSLLMGMTVMAHALNQDVQVDLLMAKITAALKAERAADALPFFVELEGMEPSLKKPLPESFHYYYIDTLDKTGDKAEALSRADIYLDKYGKKGKYYGKVIGIMGRLQVETEAEEAKQEQEDKEADEKRDREVKALAAAEEARLKAKAEVIKRAKEEKIRREKIARARPMHCENAINYNKAAEDKLSSFHCGVMSLGTNGEWQRDCGNPAEEYKRQSKAESKLCNEEDDE